MTVNKQAFFLFVIVFLFSFGEAFAQLDTVHRIPPLHARQTQDIEDHHLYLSTPKQQSFQVTITDGAGNPFKNSPYTISNSNPAQIKVGTGQNPSTKLMVTDDSLGTKLTAKGLVLKARKPFYVNARYRSPAQAGALTSKGLAGHGKEFRAGFMPQYLAQFRRNFVTSFQAVKDSTQITVKDYDPQVKFESKPNKITANSLKITLNKGETYVLAGNTDVSANLRGFLGAKIQSDKPIVVNAGNFTGSIANAGGQDIGIDQIVPVDKLGTQYASIEGNGPSSQERPMVLDAFDNTKVYVNNATTPDATINAGEWYLIPHNKYQNGSHNNMGIRTSKPAYCYQFLSASTGGGISTTSPGTNFLAPLDCGLPKEVDNIPKIEEIGNQTFSGDIILVTEKGSTVKVNGNIETGAISVPGVPDWETYKISGYTGNVKITSTGALEAGFYGVGSGGKTPGYSGLYSGFTLDLEADFAYQDTISYTRETSGCFNDTIDVAFTGEKEPGTEFKWEFGKASALNPSGNPGQFAQTNQGPYQLIYRSQNYDSVVRDSVQLVVKDGNCKDSITKAIRIFEVAPRQPATLENVTVLKDQVVKVDFKGLDVRDLNRYEVLRRKGGSGAFQQADQVVNPDTPDKRFTVLDTVNTRDTQLCYTIATVRGCKKTAHSDTFCATQLEGRPSNNANLLTWQHFSGYAIDSQLVLRKAGSGYDTIARLSGSDTTYKDQPLACNVAESYKVLSLEKGGDRTTLSDSVRLTPFDTLAPGAPRIQRLSILSDTEARLSWLRTDSSVTRHELWLKARGQAWQIIDTVGLQNTYTYTGLDTRDSQYCARIVGIDSCSANRSAFSTPHCAVQLEGRAGNLENILNWQAYEGFDNPSYEVQILSDGGWQVIGTASDTTYTDSIDLTCGVTERYRIRTISGGQVDTAFSDTTALTPVDTIAPPAADLRFASANLNNEVKLEWNWQTNTNQKFFEVWRNQGPGTNFQVLDTIVLDSTYADPTANPRTTDHQYYIIATDSCRAKNVATSDTDRLMTPTVRTGACDPKNELSWNKYEDLPRGTDIYEVYRNQTATSNEFNLQTTNNDQQTTYTDNNVQDNTTYCYRIKAVDTQSGYTSWTDSFCRKVFEFPEPDTPDLISASVTRTGETNGAVKLTWDRYEADTFAEGYALYHREQGSSGSYQRIQTTGDLDDTTYTHTGINTANKRNSYRLVVYNQCGDTSAFSETHTTIDLEATNRNGGVRLDWSAYEGFFVYGYDVERATDDGQWETITFLTRDTSLTDSTVQCGKRYTYRVIAYDRTGNSAYSDTLVRQAFDTIRPAEPELISASVSRTGTGNGAARLDWQASPAPDLAACILERRSADRSTYQVIDTIPGASSSYRDAGLNTSEQPYTYRLRAIDSCGNLSSAYTDPHRTIHLGADGISEAVSLDWTAYQGDRVVSYQVLRNDSLLYRLPGDSTRKLDQDISCDSTYTYQIRAVLSNDSTVVLSNTDQAEPFDNTPPDPVRLQRVSVAAFNDVVEVSWQPAGTKDLRAYQVYRRTASGQGPQLVGSVTDRETTTFYDSLAVTEQADLCYQVRAIDNCGNSTQLSRPDCLIQLEGQAREDLTNRLTWPPYSRWANGTRTYQVFKKRSDSLYTPIARLDSSTRTYTDEELADSAEQFCYYIRAEGFGEGTYSRSTRVCLEQSAVVYIPNTFTPASSFTVNDQFGPEGLYIDNYQMQIYNRWGEEVFSTSEGEKWDGTYNGELVPQGVYHYQIRVQGEDGTTRSFEGSITIAR